MTSGFGGAIYNRAGQAFVYRTDFVANVGYVGSAYYSFGYSEEAQPYAQMECLRFEDNVVTQFSGAVAAYSFGDYSNIHDTSFINNTVQTEDIWDDSVVHIHSYAYQYSEPIDPVFDAQSNWWNRSTGPTGWEVAHDLINVINPKVEVDNWLSSAPNCPKQDPVPLPDEICLPGGSGLSAFDEECPPTLEDFGIELDGTWTATEQEEILMAAIETGNALFAHGAGSDAVEAFREVLQGMNGTEWRTIRFSRATLGGTYCTTTKNPIPAYSAYIQCDVDVVMNQYTAVHEFGHVFVGRTIVGGSSEYLDRMQSPTGPGQALLNSGGRFVMGPRQMPTELGPLFDWQRSDHVLDSGWGSAAQWNPGEYDEYAVPAVPEPTPTGFPIRIPRIGPCGDGAPQNLPPPAGTPYPYQQNPCTFADEKASSPVGLVTEIEEAAADMFLNWIYWKNDPNNGFQDLRWRYQSYTSSTICDPGTGCSDADQSGQARSLWMDQTMANLFDEFSW